LLDEKVGNNWEMAGIYGKEVTGLGWLLTQITKQIAIEGKKKEEKRVVSQVCRVRLAVTKGYTHTHTHSHTHTAASIS